MKRSVLFGVLLAFVVVALAFAQGKPNFSGTWTPEPSAAAGGGGRGPGGPMTVTQDDKTLTVERQGRQGVQKTVYNLDGTPTTSETQMGKSTATAKWDGNKLVISTKMETEQGTREMNQTWSLSSDGKLQIERPGRGGETMTTTYTKGK